jgi:hypothetical protein
VGLVEKSGQNHGCKMPSFVLKGEKPRITLGFTGFFHKEVKKNEQEVK